MVRSGVDLNREQEKQEKKVQVVDGGLRGMRVSVYRGSTPCMEREVTTNSFTIEKELVLFRQEGVWALRCTEKMKGFLSLPDEEIAVEQIREKHPNHRRGDGSWPVSLVGVVSGAIYLGEHKLYIQPPRLLVLE